MLDDNAVYVAALFNIVGGFSYLVATIRGRVQPNRVTWFIWALVPMIAFAAELDEGVGVQALMTFMTGFGPAMIFMASFINRQAYWRLGRLDITCGLLSLFGLGLWVITQSGTLAIVLAIAADGLAAVPTVVKAYRHPRTESPWNFWCVATSAAITMLTIDHWDIAHYGFPLYIFTACAVLGTLITFRIGERIQKVSAAG